MGLSEQLSEAKQLLEKKKTFLEGVRRATEEAAAGRAGDGGGLLVAQRAVVVLLSRYENPLLWDACMELLDRLLGTEGTLTAAETCKAQELREKLRTSKPGATPDAKPAPQPEQTRLEQPSDAFQLDLEQLMSFFSSNPGRGAAPVAIDKLLLHTVPHNADPDQYTCVVCLESLPPRSKARKMPCGHLFHDACLIEWLGENNTCPTCRHEIPSVMKVLRDREEKAAKAAAAVQQEQTFYS